MRPLLTFVVFLLVSVSPVFAGPLKWFNPGGCPNGSCPVVEVPVTVEVVLPVEKEPTIDEAARRLAKGGLKPAEENKLAKIIDAPAVAKALAGHYGPGTCGMLRCYTHPEEWISGGKETQEQLDARTVPWGDGSGKVRLRRGRR